MQITLRQAQGLRRAQPSGPECNRGAQITQMIPQSRIPFRKPPVHFRNGRKPSPWDEPRFIPSPWRGEGKDGGGKLVGPSPLTRPERFVRVRRAFPGSFPDGTLTHHPRPMADDDPRAAFPIAWAIAGHSSAPGFFLLKPDAIAPFNKECPPRPRRGWHQGGLHLRKVPAGQIRGRFRGHPRTR
jgi:hypothetical protein